MNNATCPDKDALIGYLYDELPATGRRSLDAHLESCLECRSELSAFGSVRQTLAEWTAPELAAHVRIPVTAETPSPWAWIRRPAVPFAAAATLLLGATAGLSNLEIRYGADGLMVRTGWSRGADTASPPPATGIPTASASARPAAAPAVTATAATSGTPWQTDLAALETRLRRDLARPADSALLVSTRSRPDDVEARVLARVQQLLDETETRQQRNLALRVAEITRDFDFQRRADLVQIEQGLGRLEGRTAAETARTRELVNYIVRTSQQPPPR